MKKEIRLALLSLAVCATPVIAQNAQNPYPQCGMTNFDQGRNVFTIRNPAAGTVNQQCFITVYPRGAMPSQAKQDPASYFVEARYDIQLSGGGGGGGGGAPRNQGGGGGGAGAAPSQTVQYLSPGLYKMTIGTGGDGGKASGGQVEDGNPTSLTHAYTGQLIAGFAGADVWRQRMGVGTGGQGGAASAGGSRGGSGGDSGAKVEESAQAGGKSQTSGTLGLPGKAGNEVRGNAPTAGTPTAQSNAGGGGGAGVGSGGAGESSNINSVAGAGDLGGGGGGGRGGLLSADAGASGGHGFIRLTLADK